jgi:hypothetical protein
VQAGRAVLTSDDAGAHELSLAIFADDEDEETA